MSECICRTPDKDGVVRHKGKLVRMRWKSLMNGRIEELPVCWKHRTLYSGWKKAKSWESK